MIRTANITHGYAKTLETAKCLAKTPLGTGLNILWGQNGSGKTSVLQILAAHTFCPGGGWSRLLDPLEFGFAVDTPTLPDDLAHVAPGKCRAELDWDRVPVFFANGDDGFNIGLDHRDSPDGVTSPLDALSLKLDRPSAGQTRVHKIQRILQELVSGPDFKTATPDPGANSTWQACQNAQIEYLAQRPDNEPVTVLMDEPERCMSVENALQFWTVIIPHLAKHAQVIVATHHPLALSCVNKATWICPEKLPEKHLKLYQAALKQS